MLNLQLHVEYTCWHQNILHACSGLPGNTLYIIMTTPSLYMAIRVMMYVVLHYITLVHCQEALVKVYMISMWFYVRPV